MSTIEHYIDNDDIEDIVDDIRDDIQSFKRKMRTKLQNSRIWKNREHPFYEKKNKKKKNEIPKYVPTKKKYTNTEKLLKFFPTKRVTELKIFITIVATLIVIVLGIFFYMYLKSKKII